MTASVASGPFWNSTPAGDNWDETSVISSPLHRGCDLIHGRMGLKEASRLMAPPLHTHPGTFATLPGSRAENITRRFAQHGITTYPTRKESLYNS